jgi:hypothetical protein
MTVVGEFTATALVDPVSSPTISEAAARAAMLAELKNLHRSLSIQILRLQAHTEDFAAGRSQALVNAYARAAIILRDLLAK